jgi:hypothetical protein
VPPRIFAISGSLFTNLIKSSASLSLAIPYFSLTIEIATGSIAPSSSLFSDNIALAKEALKKERKKRTDVAEAEKVEAAEFEYPIERRGGELVTPLRKPAGIIDRKELKEKTTDEKDINFKIKTAERAKELDETEYNRLLETPVGREVKELYDVAKAKGTDETGKEFLSYIAQMYPKKKDQEDAATLYYNLAYTDEVSGKLGLEEKKGRPARYL